MVQQQAPDAGSGAFSPLVLGTAPSTGHVYSSPANAVGLPHLR